MSQTNEKRDRGRRLPDLLEPQPRLVIAILAMVLGAYVVLNGSPYAALFAAAGVYLIWDFVRNNGVWLAFREFRRGNLEQVRRLLRDVRRPNLLGQEAQAYYHWLKGVVDVSDERFAAARVHLLVSAAGQLRTENDRCLVQCLLAEVALREDDRAGAQEHLRLAAALPHDPRVDRMIKATAQRLEGPGSA